MANIGETLIAPLEGTVRIENDSSYLSYFGAWTTESNTSYSGGSVTYTEEPGAVFSFKVQKNNIVRIIGTTKSNIADGNHAEVYIDGELKGYINSHSEGTVYQALYFESELNPNTVHEIKLKLISGRIDLDAIDIATDAELVHSIGNIIPTPEAGWKRIDDTDKNIGFVGGWKTSTSATGAYGNSYHYLVSSTALDQTKSCVACNFTGTKLRIYLGVADIYSDDISVVIDGSAYTISAKNTRYTQANGLHLQFFMEGLEDKLHQCFIKTNTQNRFCFDCIDIEENASVYPAYGADISTQLAGVTRYNAMNINIVYTGKFSLYTSGGYMKYTDVIGDMIEFYFYGSEITLSSYLDSSRSNDIEVNLDGKVTKVSQYIGTSYINFGIFYQAFDLTEGIHRVRITNNTSSTSKRAGLRTIDVDGYLCTSDGKYIDITPAMTSDTAPEGYNSTQSSWYNSNYSAYHAFDSNQLSSNDGWFSTTSTTNGWIQLECPEQIMFNAISIKPRLDTSTTSTGTTSTYCAPRDFELLVSNDGVNYDTLYTFSESEDECNYEKNIDRVFDLPTTYKYKIMKLQVNDIYSKLGGTQVIISNLKFLLKSDTTFYLVNDNGTYKRYDESTNSLVAVESLSALNEPIVSNECISNLNVLGPFLNTLSDELSIISNKSNNIIVEGMKSTKEMIVCRRNVYTSIAQNIDFIKGNIDDNFDSIIKVIFTINDGKTWYTYNEQEGFIPIDVTITDKAYENLSEDELTQWNAARDKIYEEGINITLLGSLNFNTIQMEKLRFAIVIESTDYAKISKLNNINWQYDGKGYYKLLQPNVDVEIRQNADLIAVKPLRDIADMRVNAKNGEVNNSATITKYPRLAEKPAFEGITIVGNMTLKELNIASRAALNKLVKQLNELQELVNNSQKPSSFKTTVESYAALTATQDAQPGDTYIVLLDENHENKPYQYVYTENGTFVPINEFTIQVRDFTTSPIDLASEVTGELPVDKVNGIENYALKSDIPTVESSSEAYVITAADWKLEEDTDIKDEDKLYYYDLTHTLETADFTVNAKNAHGNILIGTENETETSVRLWVINKDDINVIISKND